TAERELAVRALEFHPARGQPVEVRRLDDRIAVAAEVVVHVVHRDEQDVEPGTGGVPGHDQEQRGQPGAGESGYGITHERKWFESGYAGAGTASPLLALALLASARGGVAQPAGRHLVRHLQLP